MIRATFKSLTARKLRLLLSSLSIVLGVSFVSGAFVLTDSLGKVFDNLFSTISENVAVDTPPSLSVVVMVTVCDWSGPSVVPSDQM